MAVDRNWDASILQLSFSAQDIGFSPMQDVAFPSSGQYLQRQGNMNASCDLPMSFCDCHRFLDGIFNSYPDTDLISAKDLDGISQRAGLSMKEILAWFDDEKARRTRLLASNLDRFPLSPARTITPANSTVSMTMSHCISSPGALSPGGIFSPVPIPAPQKTTVRAKRGRPPKNQYTTYLGSSFPDLKRPKQSTSYPCPDCENILPAERWSEHVRRVHFPDQVWECPNMNERTRNPCHIKPFFRIDNFAKHMKGEHGSADEDVPALKIACGFRTKGLFHQICGFCDDTFASRDESIEHIKNHFKEISERPNPPVDLGISEWQEKCESDHGIKRGVHYSAHDDAGDNPDEDEDEDRDGPGQGDSNTQPPNHFSNQQNGHHAPNGSNGRDDNSFYCQDFRYNGYQLSSSTTAQGTSQKADADQESFKSSVPGFENIVGPAIPFQNPTASDGGSVEQAMAAHPEEVSTCPVNLQQVESLFPSPSLHTWNESEVEKQYPSWTTFSSQHSDALQNSSYPCLTARRPSVVSLHSYNACDGDFASKEAIERAPCPLPDCGRVFKDLKTHMLTHQVERPEKCPIQTCDYHVKGFARKFDRNRHTLTHYKGRMVCGFCPGIGSATERSFNRADVFKRHLTSAHAVDETPPNRRKKMTHSTRKTLSTYAPDATGKCSTCSSVFSNAQDFYEHLDDCVLRIVQQEEPSETIKAHRLYEVEQDSVQETLHGSALPTISKDHGADDHDDVDSEEEVDNRDDGDFTLRSKLTQKGKGRCLTYSKGGITPNAKGHKKRKDYPSSWGLSGPQMKMKKRVLGVFENDRSSQCQVF